jgi:anti-sigma factor RsiW
LPTSGDAVPHHLAQFDEPPDRQGPAEELDWLAFQYISGELTPAESEAFENRLATDQFARERLAAAVELAGSVAGACAAAGGRAEVVPGGGSGGTTRRAGRFRKRAMVGWATVMAAGAAACFVLIVVGDWFSSDGPGSPSSSSSPSAVAEADLVDLAAAWAAGFDEPRGPDLAAGSFVAAPADRDSPLAGPNGTEASPAAGDAAAGGASAGEWLARDAAVPDWLLAAMAADEEPPPSPDDDEILDRTVEGA